MFHYSTCFSANPEGKLGWLARMVTVIERIYHDQAVKFDAQMDVFRST